MANNFGDELNRLRMLKGLSARELSSMVGKSPTYVSQLERGLIKNPEYSTCVDLLKYLGVEEVKISGMLDYFGFQEPQYLTARESTLVFEDDTEFANYILYPERIERLEKAVWAIHTSFVNLIGHELNLADKVISNLQVLTESDTGFQFLCQLFSLNLAHLRQENRLNILRFIVEEVHKENVEWLVGLGDDSE